MVELKAVHWVGPMAAHSVESLAAVRAAVRAGQWAVRRAGWKAEKKVAS